MTFDLTSADREATWPKLVRQLEHFYTENRHKRMSSLPDRQEVVDSLIQTFDSPIPIQEAIDHVIEGLSAHAVQVTNPNYYGMFNPRTSFPSIIADVITAVFNPQLAAWSHAPFAVEIEHLLIQTIGQKFGFPADKIDGVFATGGQEAHITAVLAALNYAFPTYKSTGIYGCQNRPIIYASASSHHAIIKAARVCGLGSDLVRLIPVDHEERMIIPALKKQLALDVFNGHQPLLVLATLGTTGSGAIDDIKQIASLKKKYNFWLHADAAYGGGAILSTQYAHLLKGIELADSITFDAHKWLSVPMAASLFICQHPYALANTFSISANFMPGDEDEIDRLSSYTHSIQWSRRFIGLKLYLPLLVFGWQGYDEVITRQIDLGNYLRIQLLQNGWKIYNNSKLPIICFTDIKYEYDEKFNQFIYNSFLDSGDAWIINYPCNGKETLRACVTNYATNESHIQNLIHSLNEKRAFYAAQHS